MSSGFGNRTLRVETLIEAPSSRVWKDVSDLSTHNEWMDDAESIEFIGSKRAGVGTIMRVKTKVGRFTLEDDIKVTDWTEPKRIAVQHDGIVQGNGAFLIIPDIGGTTFAWEENLLFPLALGGPIGEMIGKPILRRIWKNNLASLKDRVEMRSGQNPIRFFREREIELVTHGRRGKWTVDLVAPNIRNFDVKGYATGTSGYAARVAAQDRWIREEEPTAERS